MCELQLQLRYHNVWAAITKEIPQSLSWYSIPRDGTMCEQQFWEITQCLSCNSKRYSSMSNVIPKKIPQSMCCNSKQTSKCLSCNSKWDTIISELQFQMRHHLCELQFQMRHHNVWAAIPNEIPQCVSCNFNKWDNVWAAIAKEIPQCVSCNFKEIPQFVSCNSKRYTTICELTFQKGYHSVSCNSNR